MRPCLSCLSPIQGLQPGQPPICAGCWPKLSLMERGFLINSEMSLVYLRSIDGILKGNRETEELTRAANKIESSVKQQARMVAEIRDAVLSYIKWMQQGDEPWRGGPNGG